MKHQAQLISLIGIYILSMCTGLMTGDDYIRQIQVEKTMQPILPEPESLASTAWVILYVIVASGGFLLLLKLGLDRIIRYMIYFAILMGSFMNLSTFIGSWSLIASPALLAYFFLEKNFVSRNTVLIIAIPGLGALLGASIGFLPALLMIIGLSIYDFLSVFITKHMVTIAKSAGEKMPLMYSIPAGERAIGLGTGDIAIPLTFIVSVLNSHGMSYAIPTMLGGLLGLVGLFYHTMEDRGRVLPALPPICGGLILGFLLPAAAYLP